MGREARNRGTYEERKAAAIARNRSDGDIREAKERDRLLAMTPGERRDRQKAQMYFILASQWMRGYGRGGGL